MPTEDGSGDPADGNESATHSTDSASITNMVVNSIAIEDDYESISITLLIEEEITCRQGCCFCWQGCCDVCCPRDSPSQDEDDTTSPSQDEDDTTSPSQDEVDTTSPSQDEDDNTSPSQDEDDTTSPSQDEDDTTCALHFEDAWQSLCHDDPNCCVLCLQKYWKCCKNIWHCCIKFCKKCCFCKFWERLMKKLIDRESEGKIMFTYLGIKKNFTNATLSQDRNLHMSNTGDEQRIIQEPSTPSISVATHGAARSTSDGQELKQYGTIMQ